MDISGLEQLLAMLAVLVGTMGVIWRTWMYPIQKWRTKATLDIAVLQQAVSSHESECKRSNEEVLKALERLTDNVERLTKTVAWINGKIGRTEE